MGNSDKEIQVSDQIGYLGLGLDSLALVTFVTELENQYGIQFPEDFWVEQDQLTLQHFVDEIVGSDRSSRPSSAISKTTITRKSKAYDDARSKQERIAKVFELEGWLGGCYWLLRKLTGRVYRVEQKRFILAYDLEHSEIPQHRPSIEIELRLADIGDAEKIGNIQGVPYEKKMTTDIFRTRLDAGFLCFVADYDGQIVGVDWASDQGNEEYDSVGLNFEMEEGSCYGFELYEDRNFAGKGVGLALLAYALAVCKERGFKRQIGWVDADNVQMLSSSVQLLGAKKIGEFQVRRIFNKPHARWTIGGTEGSGNVVSV